MACPIIPLELWCMLSVKAIFGIRTNGTFFKDAFLDCNDKQVEEKGLAVAFKVEMLTKERVNV